MKKFACTLVLAAALVGCAAEDDNDADGEEEAGAGVIEQAVEARQRPQHKVRDLEQQLQETHEKRKREIDDQEDDDGDG